MPSYVFIHRGLFSYTMKKILLLVILGITSLNFVFTQEEGATIDEVESLFSRGEEFLRQGSNEKAISHFEQAIEIDAQHFTSHLGMAIAYWYSQEFNSSLLYATKGMDLYERHGGVDSAHYITLLRVYARSSIALDKDHEAIVKLSEMIELGVEDFYLYYQRGLAYFQPNQLDNAYNDIKIAYQMNDSHPETLLMYGLILYRKTDYQQAIDFLIKSIVTGTKDPAAYHFLGMSYYRLSDYENALENFEYFLNHPSKHMFNDAQINGAKLSLGTIYANFSEWDKAIPYLEESIKNNVQQSRCYYYLGQCFMGTGQLEEAEDIIELSLNKFPEEGWGNINKGTLYNLRGENDKASHQFQLALEKGVIKDQDIMLFNKDLSNRALAAKDTAIVLESLDKTIRFYPDEAYLYMNRLALYSKGHKYFNQKLSDIDKLLELNSGNKEKQAFYRAFKSVILYEESEYDISLREMDKAIALDSFPDYLAMRSFFKFYILVNEIQTTEKEEIELSVQREILEGVDKALTYNYRIKDMLLLKSTLLTGFEREEEACETVNEAVKLGAKVDKALIEFLCEGKKLDPSDEGDIWVFPYNISNYNQRFPDAQSKSNMAVPSVDE